MTLRNARCNGKDSISSFEGFLFLVIQIKYLSFSYLLPSCL